MRYPDDHVDTKVIAWLMFTVLFTFFLTIGWLVMATMAGNQ
jgi:hypothetical protein